MKWVTDPASGKKVRYVSRKECGLPRSRAPKGNYQRKHAICHHGVGQGNGLSLSACKSIWRGYWRYHVKNKGWNDLGYTDGFADAPDVGGAILEGRSWGRNGAHTQNGGNSLGYANCYIGDGREKIASTAWRAWRAWLNEGVNKGAFVKSKLEVSGHDDWFNKVCPGPNLKAKLHEMSKFDVTAEQEAIVDYGAPQTLVKSNKGHWYLINNWLSRYRYIDSEKALSRLLGRAKDKDQPQIELRDSDWNEDWFPGMIREEDV